MNLSINMVSNYFIIFQKLFKSILKKREEFSKYYKQFFFYFKYKCIYVSNRERQNMKEREREYVCISYLKYSLQFSELNVV